MRVVLGIIVPIVLLVLGFWYSYVIHKKYLIRWHLELRFRNLLFYALPTLVKSVTIMYLILVIHNSFHDNHYFELLLFVLVFFVFSIIQSPYSLGGFLTRSRNIVSYALDFYRSSSSRADKFINRIVDIFVGKGEFFIKIVIFIVFLIVFIPNITVFVTGNILYFILFILLIGLSLVMNNIIYFGFVSLMIFQFDPVHLSFENINLIVLISSYIVILIGLSLENRLDKKMFHLISVMEVKKFNFKLGYKIVFDSKKFIVYENMVNGYYYVYFRAVGIVMVYYCDFDIKLSKYVISQLIRTGKKVLLSNNEY